MKARLPLTPLDWWNLNHTYKVPPSVLMHRGGQWLLLRAPGPSRRQHRCSQADCVQILTLPHVWHWAMQTSVNVHFFACKTETLVPTFQVTQGFRSYKKICQVLVHTQKRKKCSKGGSYYHSNFLLSDIHISWNLPFQSVQFSDFLVYAQGCVTIITSNFRIAMIV